MNSKISSAKKKQPTVVIFLIQRTAKNMTFTTARQENISLKHVAILTQSSPFIPLVLIVSELLLKTTKSEK